MAILSKYFEYVHGPALYKIYNSKSKEVTPYKKNLLEGAGWIGTSFVKSLWNIGTWTWPIIVYYFRNSIPSNIQQLYSFNVSQVVQNRPVFFSMAFINIAWLLRALGRLINSDYREFHRVLNSNKKNDHKDSTFKNFEFDFSAWPVEFVASKGSISNFSSFWPLNLISRIVLKIVYPGSIKTLNVLMFESLCKGREELIRNHGAERYKVRTVDKNDIDVIFVNRKNGSLKNGNVLVIVCEGNCGFYECGSMMTAVEAQYSVIGWNHPGFGGSTGTPFPSQEKNAVEAVMEFATDRLGFSPENIILYGWSIGGFTSSWAARQCPDVRGLILDATFDNILPLAKTRVPPFMVPLATSIFKNDINLDVLENVKHYSGPVSFIRRSNDEMICTKEGDIATNRCNHLVFEVLKHRYPKILDDKRENLLKDWLRASPLKQGLLRDGNFVDKNQCLSLLNDIWGKGRPRFPVQNGDELSDEQKTSLTVFLVDTQLKEFPSTHCVPLAVNMFREPTI